MTEHKNQSLSNNRDNFIEKKICLLSYPRSGSNWLRYMTEVVYKKPTQAPNFKASINSEGMNGPLVKLLNNSQIKLNKSYSPMIHIHDVAHRQEAQDIIFIIRNYKEFGASFEGIQMDRYVRILKSFDQFRPLNWFSVSKKLLIRYEDLIDEEKIKSIFVKLNNFFESEDDQHENEIKDFIKNLEEHKKNSIDIYEKHNIKTLTKGKGALFHSKQMSKVDRKEIDEKVKRKSPALFEKYLKIYEESD